MLVMGAAGVAAAVALVFSLTSANNSLPSHDNIVNTTPTGFPSIQGGSTIFTKINTTTGTFALASTQAIKRFSSVEELQTFLDQSLASREMLASALRTSGTSYGVGAGLNSSPSIPEGLPAPSASSPQSLTGQSQSSAGKASSTAGGIVTQYSTTNVQVANVDEPDFLKNDGKYVYVLTGDKLAIVDAYPAQNASVVVKVGIDIPQGQSLQNMFLNKDRLVIFYQDYTQEHVIPQYDYVPQPIYSPKTHVVIMDVTDRQNPRIIHDYKISGNYNDARMIGNYVYIVTNSNLDDYHHPILPRIMESSKVIATPDIYYFDNPEQSYSFTTVTSVSVFGINDNSTILSKTFLMDPASTVYASENNLYITYQKYMPYYYYQTNNKDRFFKSVVPQLPTVLQNQIRAIDQDTGLTLSEKWDKVASILQDYYNKLSESEKSQLFDNIQKALADYDAQIQKAIQRTVIHKIAIGSNGSLDYVGKGEVPGRLLNQFSMDENGSRFRIATTSEYYSQYKTYRYNNVYVLDGKLNTVGSLEQIAPDESIYSARFISDRLYLVTFRQVDPFFVIDLSSDQPKLLGKLKLAGYSNYLHPYDANHIIGIGRDTMDNGYGAVEPLGVKIALSDVSDVTNPVSIDTYQIGSFGTDSEVLYDHKALFFDKGKNILSIPITISQYGGPVPLYGGGAGVTTSNGGSIIGSTNSSGSGGNGNVSGNSAAAGMRIMEPPFSPIPNFWRGFYVFGVDPQHGFTLKAKIEHLNSSDSNGFYGYGIHGSRSFYIDSVLYTLSVNNLMKMNSLEDPSHEINTIDLGASGEIIKYQKLPADSVNLTNGTVGK